MAIATVGKALAKYSYKSHTKKLFRSKPKSKQTVPAYAGQHLFNYMNLPSLSSGGITYPDTASHPVLTSATGQSPRGKKQKQMRSTSHSNSKRRNNYAYARKRKYY